MDNIRSTVAAGTPHAMFPVTARRARGTPCSYCAVPALHPNQQCCLNCKNHPFDVLDPEDAPPPTASGSPTPPISPISSLPQVRESGHDLLSPPRSHGTSHPLVFEVRNVHDGSFVRISADDLKDDALHRYFSSGLVFETGSPTDDAVDAPPPDGTPSTITANYAIGFKIHGNAFGKTCLRDGSQCIELRSDENMAGSIIIRKQDPALPSWRRSEYSISEDSVCYSKVLIKAGAKAWYSEEVNGHPATWLFHEQTLRYIEDRVDEGNENQVDGDNEKMHGVLFNEETEAQYREPDNRFDNHLLVSHEGIEFSIKRENLVVEVKVNENAYAQKLGAKYMDQEEFWFQFGDKVWVQKDDEFDSGRVIVTYEDEKFSITKEDIS